MLTNELFRNLSFTCQFKGRKQQSYNRYSDGSNYAEVAQQEASDEGDEPLNGGAGLQIVPGSLNGKEDQDEDEDIGEIEGQSEDFEHPNCSVGSFYLLRGVGDV